MKKRFPILALVAGAFLFIAGVIYLFLLRFESGDVYPPYSSLRADPLGTMALYEGLGELPGINVRRDLSTTSKLPEEPHTTYLHLAAETTDWRAMPADIFNEVESFANRGGRLIIAMRPEYKPSFWNASPPTLPPGSTNTATTNNPAAKPAKKPTKKNEQDAEMERPNEISLKKRWGVEFGYDALVQGDPNYLPAEVINQTDLHLPPSLEWHSALVLTNLDHSWKTIYSRGKNGVVAERRFGQGSIVIATDSFFVSNEAMWKDRQTDLLTWLIGATTTHIVFDESHLGITESSGVAVLMRKYRLTGLIAALITLALLFIWKNSTSLVPPPPDVAASGYIAGKETTAGFVNLLRRNIPARNILDVCFDEWTKSLLQRRNFRIAGVDEAQTVMETERARPATARNPLRAYQEIAQVLKKPKFKTDSSSNKQPNE